MNWIFHYIEIRDKEAKISLDRESTKMNFWPVIVARMELFQRITVKCITVRGVFSRFMMSFLATIVND